MAKTSTELYSKIQLVIDELDKRFFSGAKKENIPQLVFAINNKCRSCVVAYVQADALYDKKTDTKLQYMGKAKHGAGAADCTEQKARTDVVDKRV